MSKVIKLKQSDIERIVENIIKESNGEFDDFDTQVQPEELMYKSDNPYGTSSIDDDTEDTDAVKLTLGQDENGNFYVMKDGETNDPQVVAKTK